MIHTPFGNVLIAPRNQGKLVCNNSCGETVYYYGYDFKGININEENNSLRSIWNHIFEKNNGDELIHGLAVMENDGIECLQLKLISLKAKHNLLNYIRKVCDAPDAPIVCSESQKNELDYWGVKCILVSRTTYEILSEILEPFDKVKEKAVNLTFDVINEPIDDRLLNEIVSLINKVYWLATRDRVKICSFQRDNLFALYGRKDGTIYLNKNILNDYKELLITLAHEFSHDFGLDGSKDHVESIQTILAECFMNERNKDAE